MTEHRPPRAEVSRFRIGTREFWTAALLGLLLIPGAAAGQDGKDTAKGLAPPPPRGETDEPKKEDPNAGHVVPLKNPDSPAQRLLNLPPQPAGLVQFPGGKVVIGIGRKELLALVKSTELGSMANLESAIENELMTSTPAYERVLPEFWMGKYEITRAQWSHFLQTQCRVEVTIVGPGESGPRNLEDIERMFTIVPPFQGARGQVIRPEAVSWEKIYEINEEILQPTTGKDGDPARRLPATTWKTLALPPGRRIVTFRRTLPEEWKALNRLKEMRQLETPPPGTGDLPVTGISLADAIAFAKTYGVHVPLEGEWEAGARGPKGEIYPEGKDFDPLGHAWKGFDAELARIKPIAPKELERARLGLQLATAIGELL